MKHLANSSLKLPTETAGDQRVNSTHRMMKNYALLWQQSLHALRMPFVVHERSWFTAALFGLLLLAHLILLPADTLGMAIGWQSFQYIKLDIAVFAFLFAFLETVLIVLWIHLTRQKSQCRKASAAGGMVVGIVSPLLCCTPLLPAFLSIVALVFPTAVYGVGFRIQYFANAYQSELLIAALGLLLLAIVQNASRLNSTVYMQSRS